MTRAEALIAAAFRGFAEALVAADEKPAKKEREPRPAVVAQKDVEAAVQAVLPGILQAIVGEEPAGTGDLDQAFGLGDLEEEGALEARRRAQGPGAMYDPNLPGTGGWSPAPE